MLYDNAIYLWKKETENNGCYQICRKITEQRTHTAETLVPEITICAEEITQIGDGILMAKEKSGTYSLYGSSVSIKMQRKKQFGSLYFFIGRIEKFILFDEQLLLYRTQDGWFFLFLNRAFWNIENIDILERRRSMVPRFSNASDEVIKIKRVAMNKNNVIIYTNNKKFILFEGEPFCKTDVPKVVYDDEGHQHLNLVPLHGEFLRIYWCGIIDELPHSIKIYPNEEDEFYIGSILSIHECKQPYVLYTEIVEQWEAERGMYFSVANKSGEQALIYVEDGRTPRLITNWAKTTIVMRKQISSKTYFGLIEDDVTIEISDDINED